MPTEAETDTLLPPWVVTLDDRTRWDACVQIAEVMTGTRYPAEDAWMAARSLFRSELTT